MLEELVDGAGVIKAVRRVPFDFSDSRFQTNVFAKVAWVLGIVGVFFVAVPLALFALTRIPKADQNSRDLAFGALISGFGVPLAIALFYLLG
ncbi:hypothetical protein AB0H76_19480 [Nocardia sp. NPDC050712]|uniref:hypothetical protein n=1 Tax=Nocardia sp. NPDC050712 TaxID=3155518 RepID=UPI0033E415FC